MSVFKIQILISVVTQESSFDGSFSRSQSRLEVETEAKLKVRLYLFMFIKIAVWQELLTASKTHGDGLGEILLSTNIVDDVSYTHILSAGG